MQIQTTFLTDSISQISPLAVQAYLKNNAWQKVNSKRAEVAIFHKKLPNDVAEIILPKDRQLLDYKRTMLRAAETIAFSEQRSIESVLTDLLLPPADIIRFQSTQHLIENGIVSLNQGLNWIENIKKVLLATACDEVQATLSHPQLNYKKAQHFIQNCRLGQAEKGDFILPIICPLTKHTTGNYHLLNQNQQHQNQVFARKVTTRLLRSIQELKQKIDNDDIESLLQADEWVMSINLMKALRNLKPLDRNGELQISATWSRNTIAPTIPSNVRLSSDYFPYLDHLVNTYCPKKKSITTVFYGKIIALTSDELKADNTSGVVVFQFMHENEILKARVALDKVDYGKACDAHKYEQVVRIAGELSYRDGTWLMDCLGFEVLG